MLEHKVTDFLSWGMSAFIRNLGRLSRLHRKPLEI